MNTSIRWKGYNWYEVRNWLISVPKQDLLGAHHKIKKNNTLVLKGLSSKLHVPLGHYIVSICGRIDARSPMEMEKCR